MFKLNPSEELVIEVTSSPSAEAKKKSRYLIVMGVVLIGVAIFYNYASNQDSILSFIFWAAALGAVISFIAYFVTIHNAKKKNETFKYVITNRRIVQVDETESVIREVLRNKVKRVDVVYLSGGTGSIIINPREISAQERYKRELKGESGDMYTKDTFIISHINSVDKIATIIKG